MSFETLTEKEERELHRLFRFYWKEAERCETAKAYLAGGVMLGSVLETILMLMVNAHSDDVFASGAAPNRNKKPLALLKWDLSQLIKVAKAVGWLPGQSELNDDWNSRKAKIGDYAEVARAFSVRFGSRKML